jgi:hypothetical protein
MRRCTPRTRSCDQIAAFRRLQLTRGRVGSRQNKETPHGRCDCAPGTPENC